ncbi:MAG: 4-(cytidine 5'-diphospho)-2-C-methyl-D-erythritol kinase [Lachnospiraceae bacterium]|nr:4-(cytidine 5'-diphospho)-2-C-methyl-D-erythritol kinase [Lachnospiraceae bacterium]
MDSITRKACGKINLILDVTGKRPDGYHDIRTVMQTVDVYDTLTFTKNDSGLVALETPVKGLPENEDNLVIRACELMRSELGIKEGVTIDLIKEIPVAAGMGGGSADAACTLLAMNELFDAGLSKERLAALALTIGADVPYLLHGGTCLAEGVGEILTPLPAPPDCSILIAALPASVSTAQVYGELLLTPATEHPDVDGFLRALRAGDLYQMTSLMGNLLEPVTKRRVKAIDEIENTMLDYGAIGAMMTGSGPTVFGIFDRESDAVKAYHVLRDRGGCADLFVCRPVR